MLTKHIREEFLKFFEANDHKRIKSRNHIHSMAIKTQTFDLRDGFDRRACFDETLGGKEVSNCLSHSPFF